MGRTLNIIPKYARFFIKNSNERYLILRGGRRSGKSISTYQWVTLLLLSERSECIVLTSTYPASTSAIKDFTLATGLPVTGNAIYGNSHIFQNGSVISFRAFDAPQKAQGTMCDYAIVEEALNIDEQVFNVFSMSVKQQIFFLFNPTRTAWTDKYINKDGSNYLTTNFNDNPYLTEAQIAEFELIKQRAMRPEATILDRYNYSVYYKGEFGEMSGKVFLQVFECSDEEFEKIPVVPSYGLDFSFVDNRDFTALVAVKIWENCVYARELLYSNQMSKDEDLVKALREVGIDEYVEVSADYGGLGRSRIQRIRDDYGLDFINCRKGKILEDIQRMLQFDRIVVTGSSVNLRSEMDGYELSNEGKPKGSDHAIDGMKYAFSHALVNQIF